MTDIEHKAHYAKLHAQYKRGLLSIREYETALAVLHEAWKA